MIPILVFGITHLKEAFSKRILILKLDLEPFKRKNS